MIKRIFDLGASALGLVLLSPVFLVVAVAIKLDSPGPVFFRQERMGRNFRPFRILKFRSMSAGPAENAPQITASGDPRVTRLGRLLRRTKVDELPQLVNVLRGDMSLVGPRPEVRRYVELFGADYDEILKYRPGMTDLASIRFRDEEELLAAANDPETEYVSRVLPEKIKLGKEYVRRASFAVDIELIISTLLRILPRAR